MKFKFNWILVAIFTIAYLLCISKQLFSMDSDTEIYDMSSGAESDEYSSSTESETESDEYSSSTNRR